MKNEQEIVRSVFDAYIRDAKATSTKKDRPTFDMLEEVKNRAIKALEQQPSEDCVSRAEVNKLYDEYRPRLATHVSEFGDKLKALPPVTPTFPKNATNGDMIKAMFPNLLNSNMDLVDAFNNAKKWWNALYKRGNSDGQY